MRLPLCEMTLSPPFFKLGRSSIALALKTTESEILIIPILFGPNILKFPCLAICKICFSKFKPSEPDSENPPDKMVAHLIFIETASLIASIILFPSTAIKT